MIRGYHAVCERCAKPIRMALGGGASWMDDGGNKRCNPKDVHGLEHWPAKVHVDDDEPAVDVKACKGFIVYADELVVEVVDIRMKGGVIEFHAVSSAGNINWSTDRPVSGRIFDPSMQLVFAFEGQLPAFTTKGGTLSLVQCVGLLPPEGET